MFTVTTNNSIRFVSILLILLLCSCSTSPDQEIKYKSVVHKNASLNQDMEIIRGQLTVCAYSCAFYEPNSHNVFYRRDLFIIFNEAAGLKTDSVYTLPCGYVSAVGKETGAFIGTRIYPELKGKIRFKSFLPEIEINVEDSLFAVYADENAAANKPPGELNFQGIYRFVYQK